MRQSRFEWKAPLQHPQALAFRAPQHTQLSDLAGSFNEMSGKIPPPRNPNLLIYITFQ